MKTVSSVRIAACTAACLLSVSLALPTLAQIPGLPAVSPHAVTQQTIGITQVEVDYHRPSTRDREVWGVLVPYDTVWRAGANDNTVIRFSDPVKVEGKDLPAGQYGLHMIPTAGTWTIIFSENSTSWGSFSYDEAEDVLRVEVQPKEAPFEEQLRYGFRDISTDSGVLTLSWAGLEVPIQIEVDTHDLVVAKIRRDLRSTPGFNAVGWANAANYCLINNINHEEALGWAERSIQMQDTFLGQWTRAGLLEQLDRGDEAREARLAAVASGNEGQVNFAGYQLLQQGRTDEAIELFQKNVERHPDSWNVYDSLAEAYQTKGDTRRARELYTKALSMAPENQQGRINGLLEQLRS
jgi:tetratricopeptide (TPR) repeat protein